MRQSNSESSDLLFRKNYDDFATPLFNGAAELAQVTQGGTPSIYLTVLTGDPESSLFLTSTSIYVPDAGLAALIEIRRDGEVITDGLFFTNDTFSDNIHVLSVAVPFLPGVYTFTTLRRGAGFPFPQFQYVSASISKVDDLEL